MTLILDALDEDILLFCAFRYALGRRSYVVGTIAMIIRDNWNDLSSAQRDQYVKEIREAIDKNRAGDKMDVEEWNKIIQLYEAKHDH
jgi:hypothetical protein